MDIFYKHANTLPSLYLNLEKILSTDGLFLTIVSIVLLVPEDSTSYKAPVTCTGYIKQKQRAKARNTSLCLHLNDHTYSISLPFFHRYLLCTLREQVAGDVELK